MKKTLRHGYWVLLSLVFVFWHQSTSAQGRVFSEAPVIFEKGIRMSSQLTVRFKYRVLDLPKGVTTAAVTDIAPEFSRVQRYFQELQRRHGEITLIKQVPSAMWGDVWRRDRATGEMVRIHDMSQLFTVKFSQFAPIDSIITALQGFDEVEYAHGPIQTISCDSPNDPKYVSGEQWNLPKINASFAWDITHGSPNVWVGIIEQSGVKRDYEDFINADGSSQFVPGLGGHRIR